MIYYGLNSIPKFGGSNASYWIYLWIMQWRDFNSKTVLIPSPIHALILCLLISNSKNCWNCLLSPIHVPPISSVAIFNPFGVRCVTPKGLNVNSHRWNLWNDLKNLMRCPWIGEGIKYKDWFKKSFKVILLATESTPITSSQDSRIRRVKSTTLRIVSGIPKRRFGTITVVRCMVGWAFQHEVARQRSPPYFPIFLIHPSAFWQPLNQAPSNC